MAAMKIFKSIQKRNNFTKVMYIYSLRPTAKNREIYSVEKYKGPDPERLGNPDLDPKKILPDPQHCMIHEVSQTVF